MCMIQCEDKMERLLEWVCPGHEVANLFDQRFTFKISGRSLPRNAPRA